jgi:chemotaxis protein MotB
VPVLKCKACGAKISVKAGVPDWMLTFGDMNSLLLTFFVLLITMSTFDIKKFHLVLSSFQGTFGVMHGGETIRTVKNLPDLGLKPSNLKQMQVFSEIISFSKEQMSMITDALSFKDDEVAKKFINIREDERGLVIQIAEPVLFAPGGVDVLPSAAPQLKKIGRVLSSIKGLREKPIRIEGHTDDLKIPKANERYNSNWELSVMRAVNVLKFFVNNTELDESRGISVAGYGEFRPRAVNEMFKDPETGEMVDDRALNRRVEIVVLKKKINLEKDK